ncbi:hypothetical protein GCM10020331_058360 [Ectobacillus funiculus]
MAKLIASYPGDAAIFTFGLKERPFSSREIVLIAVLAAIAAISRVPFAPLPSVQPTSFVIIVSAIVLGKEAGFLIGATAALVSNLFFWGKDRGHCGRCFSWGLMGLTAGVLGRTFILQNKWGGVYCLGLYGDFFIWLDYEPLFLLTFFCKKLHGLLFLGAYAASVYFDLAHALSNVFFSWIV